MERDGKAMRFVANTSDQQQGRTIDGERQGVGTIASEQELFLLRDAGRDQVSQPELFQCAVGSRQLSFATIDQDQIGKRTADLEKSAVASQHDLVHGGEIVYHCAWGPTPTRCRCAARRLAARGGRRRWRFLAFANGHDYRHRTTRVRRRFSEQLKVRAACAIVGVSRAPSPEPPSPGPRAREPRILNFRYSDFFIRPSSQTTIDATVSLP